MIRTRPAFINNTSTAGLTTLFLNLFSKDYFMNLSKLFFSLSFHGCPSLTSEQCPSTRSVLALPTAHIVFLRKSFKYSYPTDGDTLAYQQTLMARTGLRTQREVLDHAPWARICPTGGNDPREESAGGQGTVRPPG